MYVFAAAIDGWRCSMKQGYLASLGVAALVLGTIAILPVRVTGQAQSGGRGVPSRPYTPPKTADGQPDLQGTWANNNATPLERPKILEGRAVLNEQEVAALKKRAAELFAGDGDAAFGDAIYEAVLSEVQKYKPTTFDKETGNYNAFWLVERDFDNRTSLVTDPSDGRIPPMTPEGKKRQAATNAAFEQHLADGPESRPASERCLTFGMPDLLAGYNSYYQILQSKDYVVILTERIHDARLIPLDGRPHPPASVRHWLGDSRGRWEGNTLVVDTTNFNGKSGFGGLSTEKLHLIERFTRVGPNTVNYEITIDDPATWTRSWTLMIPLKHTKEQIYEYACHEGNSGMVGILAGARALEKAAGQAKKN
jgi:hypothetical protein